MIISMRQSKNKKIRKRDIVEGKRDRLKDKIAETAIDYIQTARIESFFQIRAGWLSGGVNFENSFLRIPIVITYLLKDVHP